MHKGRNTFVVAMGAAAMLLVSCSSDKTATTVPAATVATVATTAAGSPTTVADAGGSTTTAAASNALDGFKLASYIQDHVKSGKKLNFVYITNDLSSPYTAAQKAGVDKAVKELGVDAELQGPPTGAAQDQVSLIQTLIAQKKIDGLVVAAVNVDSLKPVIQSAFDAGIPFISAFTDQPSSKQLAFIGEDNTAFGKYEGELLAKTLSGKKGKVIGVSVDTAAGWSKARMDGLKAGMASNPDLEFVGPINTGIEPGQMFNAIQNAMQANPGAIAIASVDCCSVNGAAKWANTSGNSGKVVVIGTDALKQTITDIQSGTVAFSISQDPVGQVFTAISQLQAFVTKGTPPKTTLMPPLLVNKDNAATVTPEG
ncbi:MAG: sugar ABC transporter substrate-binding protein [Ilumatobacteraceae bacterium]